MNKSSKKRPRSQRWFYVLVFCLIVVMGKLSAQNSAPPQPLVQSTTLLSPHCDEVKIKGIAGKALVSIQKIDEHKYSVTLDTSLLSFSNFVEKMMQAGCY